MYMDKMLEMSDSQTMASLSSAQVYNSTDIIDLGGSETDAFGTAILPDIGAAGTLIWHVMCDTTLAGSSNTVAISLVTKSSASSIHSGSTTLDSFTTITDVPAGTHYQRPIAIGTMAASDRYMATLYTGGTAQASGGAFSSWISLDYNLTDSSGGAIQT